jgi:hypothetical protein
MQVVTVTAVDAEIEHRETKCQGLLCTCYVGYRSRVESAWLAQAVSQHALQAEAGSAVLGSAVSFALFCHMCIHHMVMQELYYWLVQ